MPLSWIRRADATADSNGRAEHSGDSLRDLRDVREHRPHAVRAPSPENASAPKRVELARDVVRDEDDVRLDPPRAS